MKKLLAVTVLLLSSACSGGGGSNVPATYSLAGSYYGTVVSNANNSGNMGISTDASGNGNFAVQYPGEPAISETFAPPVSSVSGTTLTINGTIAGSCIFKLTASMVNANTIAGSYTTSCPGYSTATANFSLPRGTYSISAKDHRMTE